MSNPQTSEVLELKVTRKKLTKGIGWAVKQFGADSKEVFIATAALKHLDEYIVEQGYQSAFWPAIVRNGPEMDETTGKGRA